MRGGRRALLFGGLLALVLAGGTAWAGGVQTIETVDVVDSKDQPIGSADTATQGTVVPEQLDSRPTYREGELLENVPGLVVTQHSGEGKANQYYLRGFNLDHGTDIAITVDDMPVNMPSHGHGQGYADLNFMIPELLSGMKYEKGPYFADQGDFATAGAVQMGYLDKLETNLAEAGAGSFGYVRALTAGSRSAGTGTVLAAAEVEHLDGPWDRPDDYRKGNAVVRYSQGTETNGWTTTAMAYSGTWNATNQIPQRLVDDGQLSYFGTLNPTDGGASQRYSFSGRYIDTDATRQWKASAYVISSTLDLYNDFTFFLNNPAQGDQFHQHDDRTVEGAKVSYTHFGSFGAFDTENTIGAETRNDQIHIGLFQTQDRQYLSTDRTDTVEESSVAVYVENRTQWLSKLRTVLGLRNDLFYAHDVAFDPLDQSAGIYTSAHHDNSLTANMLSPKASLILGPWAQTEFYLSAGEGFHSNDIRTAAYPVQAEFTSSGPATGTVTSRYPLLEQAIGYEVGMRSVPLPHWQTSLALFELHLASEQVFDGDAGMDAPSGPSTRTGVEFANFYTPYHSVIVDVDIAYSQARFDRPVYDGTTVAGQNSQTVTCCTGRYIAGSPALVAGAGLAVVDIQRWFGGLQYRYYGPRPLTNDDSVQSGATSLINLRVGYKVTEIVTVQLDVNNLLDQREQDVAYYYLSRVSPSATPAPDVHFHAAEPLGARLTLIAKW